jgi:hypothetical protein
VPAPRSEGDDDLVLLRVPADPRYARVVRVAVSAYAVRLGLAVAAVQDLRLAVDEALILLMGAHEIPARGADDRPDLDEAWEGPAIVITLDAAGDRPPVTVELHLDPAPATTDQDPDARSRFEEIVPRSVSIVTVDQAAGQVALRHPG